MKYIIAKQLGGKKIISTNGEEIGRLADASIDTDSGKIVSLLLRPSQESVIYNKLEKTEDGLVIIPFKAVVAISDVIVVNEKMLL